MTDDEFLCAFERCTLARKDWTHEAHVRMAWLYAMRIPSAGEVLDRVRGGIKKLNAVFVRRQQVLCRALPSKPKDPRGLDGYHETITVAFVTLIASRVEPGEDFAAFRGRNPDLFDSKLSVLLKHYSPERLFSPAAKVELLAPDLEPLPAPSHSPVAIVSCGT
ncbi:MAG: hypothetical protein J0I06_27600 [Planctomycetes bacterium]|nr:hypothetical protein [Planctomycetota bacterium]